MRLGRILAGVAALVLVAGCGSGTDRGPERDGSPEAHRSPGTNTSPDARTETEGTEGGTSEGSGSDGASGNGGTNGGGRSGSTPRPSAPPNAVFPPQAERYIYVVSGTRRTPSMSQAEPYAAGATIRWDYSSTVPVSSWVEITYTGTLDADQARFERTVAFRRDGLRWAWWQTSRPGPLIYNCRFQPPIEFANAPMRPETYPTQSWTGPGCTGRSDFTVVRQEDVVDASGKEWKGLWRVEEKTTYQMQSVSGTITAVHWFSHDQGVDIRTEVVEEGTAGVSPFRYEQAILLAELVPPKSKS
jgi:hypothetical protein